ncbi:glycosyltransferase family 2 protein, partial [Candidatus Parcubacteria bacterium]|nr:glycosyltransferase family 2 protein [Candidatus Parcubacteria bacterium]
MTASNKVTIVIPIYGDWPSLSDCIESLKQNVDFDKHKAILINDCGPEADFIEGKIKQSIKGCGSFK